MFSLTRKKRRKYYILIVAFIIVVICISSYNLYHNNQVTKPKVLEKVTETSNNIISKQMLNKYIKKLERNPKDAKTLHEMGILYSKMNDYGIAIAAIEEAIRIDPSNYDAHISLALVNLKEALELKKTGADKEVVDQKLNKAEEISNKAVTKKPNKLHAYTLLGDIHTAQGLNGDAIEDYKRALEIDNSIDSIHLAIAKLYLKDGKTDLAEYQCKKFLSENNPDSGLINNLLSTIYEQQGDLTKAIEYLKRASKTNPDDLSIHARLSLLHLDSGDYDAAINEANYIFAQRPSKEFINLTEQLDLPRNNSLGKTKNTQGNIIGSTNNSEVSLNDINIASLRKELSNIIKKEPATGTLHLNNLQKNEPHFVTDFTDRMIAVKVDDKDIKVVSSQTNNITNDDNIKANNDTEQEINQKKDGKNNREIELKKSSFECMLNELFSIPKEISDCGLDPFCQMGVPVELVIDLAGCYFND